MKNRNGDEPNLLAPSEVADPDHPARIFTYEANKLLLDLNEFVGGLCTACGGGYPNWTPGAFAGPRYPDYHCDECGSTGKRPDGCTCCAYPYPFRGRSTNTCRVHGGPKKVRA